MPSLSQLYYQNVLLADDDTDDCLLFKDAIEELPLSIHFTTVQNGERLMQLLNRNGLQLPDILFLDLNMPRKNGFQCLSEIKQNEKLKHIPVIIFSTSFEQRVVNLLYKAGAQHYLRKPNEFSKLKAAIHHALIITKPTLNDSKTIILCQPTQKDFVL